MDEFLAVAKSLEIKALCNAENMTNDQPSTTDLGALNKNLEEQAIVSDDFKKQPPQERRRENVNGKYECEPCQKTFTSKQGFYFHKHTGSFIMMVRKFLLIAPKI